MKRLDRDAVLRTVLVKAILMRGEAQRAESRVGSSARRELTPCALAAETVTCLCVQTHRALVSVSRR